MSEATSRPEQLPPRERFLADLAAFVIEAGRKGWAGGAPKVDQPQRPGFKELAYQRDEWEYRDSYAGYYLAPGSSVVYYKMKPVWYMTYGGDGQTERYFNRAKETYAFLRQALGLPHPALPVRGPGNYVDPAAGLYYSFQHDGSMVNATWTEAIHDGDDNMLFAQRGDVGLIVDKTSDREPIYPWNL